MLFIRLIAAMVIGGAGALGAQYGVSMVLGAPVGPQADERGESDVEERVYDDRLPLPYDDGDAAAFLASALAGTEAQHIWQADSRIDLGALAAEVARPGSGGEASCDTSHVAMHCTLRRSDGYGFSFGLQGTSQGWTVAPNSVRQLDNA